mgnify:CR=1 FL=1
MDAQFKHDRRFAELDLGADDHAIAACHAANQIDNQTLLLAAAIMHKLGERTLTISQVDVSVVLERRIRVEQTDDGVQIKIV